MIFKGITGLENRRMAWLFTVLQHVDKRQLARMRVDELCHKDGKFDSLHLTHQGSEPTVFLQHDQMAVAGTGKVYMCTCIMQQMNLWQQIMPPRCNNDMMQFCEERTIYLYREVGASNHPKSVFV